MTRWISPTDGRLSNGWYARIVWPRCIYGNQVDLVLDMRTMTTVDIGTLDPTIAAALRAVRIPWEGVNAQGDRVDQVQGQFIITLVDGARTTLPVMTDAWESYGRIERRRGVPWFWSAVGGGPNEQYFAHGRPLDENDGDLGLWIEMPVSELQVHYEATSDTWVFAGFASGAHGTPDYPDGLMHAITGVPGDLPLSRFADHIATFDHPIRLPDQVNADVATFKGKAPAPGRDPLIIGSPIRYGIGLETSPEDERTVIAACRQSGGSLTVYDNNLLIDVEGSLGPGTKYRPALLERAYRIQQQSVGVVIGMRAFDEAQAGWALEDCARAIIAGDAAWLHLDPAIVRPMPVVFSISLGAGPGGEGGLARRLEELVRIGAGIGVIGFDVFDVPGSAASAAWQAWASRWLKALRAVARVDVSRWPKTGLVSSPPPVVDHPPEPPVTDPVVPPTSTTSPLTPEQERRAQEIRDRAQAVKDQMK